MLRSYDDSLRLMAVADVLLQPSKVEGFGMPVLEAQLLGTPVVTTAWGAMADYTRCGVLLLHTPLPLPLLLHVEEQMV